MTSAARVQTRVTTFVFLTIFLDLIGFGIVIPLMPVYVKTMGGSAQAVGFILACFSFTQLLATPMLGRLSDRYGRRPVILISLAGNAASMIIYALAVHLANLPLLFVSRIIAGATAGNIAACQAAIADVTTDRDRAKGMGLVGAAIGLGMVLGPAAGSALSALGSFAPPLGSAALALVDLIGAFFLMPETRREAPASMRPEGMSKPSAYESLRGDKRVLVVFGLYFLMFLGLANLQVALPLLAIERLGWTEREIGIGFSAFGAITLVIQGFLIGRIVRRFRAVDVSIFGGLAMALGLLLIGLAHGTWMLLAGISWVAVGMGVNGPVLSTMAAEMAGEKRRGTVLGLAQSAGGLARTVGPIAAGFLFLHFGAGAPFYGGCAVTTLLALLAVTLKAAPETRAVA